jgi:hypothetical protein
MIFPNAIDGERFDRITVRERWPPNLPDMYEHFQRAISQARSEFLRDRQGIWDVHNLKGTIERCTVELEENGQYALVRRENRPGDRLSRVPVVMGTLCTHL